MNFLPLHIYTGYSFLKSGIQISNLLNEAKKDEYTSLGICDKNVMYGFAEFNKICLENNVKPIFGMDLDVGENTLSLFIESEEGYKNLSFLSSLYQKNNKVELEELKEHTQGLLCVFSIINPLFKNIKEGGFAHDFAKIASYFKVFLIGIEIYTKDQIDFADTVRNFAQTHSYDCIAFPVNKYLKKEDAIVIKILNAVEKQETININDPIDDSHNFFKNQDEIKKFYSASELANSVKFFEPIRFTFIVKRGELSKYRNELNIPSKDLLKSKILDGLKLRKIDLIRQPEYRNRLNYEFVTIDKMGYCDYFLIVQDYVMYAKNNNVMVGPGRGSAAGCLISYLLGITEIDPLRYGLLFERFLNPQRRSMPDIDVDFADIYRDKIFAYLSDKYGYEHVARIVAFQTFGAKQALRDTTSVFGYNTAQADEICKTIPSNFNAGKYDLNYAYENIPAFKEVIESRKIDYKDIIFKYAHLIEGLPRQKGLHAAGVVLNNDSLPGIIPLTYDPQQVTQYEKDYLEEQGFLKFDILGLNHLTIITNCLNSIKNNRGLAVDLEKIDYNDEAIYKLILNNSTMGIFQLDTSAALQAINSIKPTCFADIVATISLDRPGPQKQIPIYSQRKNQHQRIVYPDKSLIQILKETYGIIIYQEQIMQIARVFSGFTFAQADLFRRAISKKHKDEMLKMKDDFIKGAINNKHDVKTANNIFNLIENFANYGFNKSHAVCYAKIAIQEAYLKAFYAPEFYTAILDQKYGSDDARFTKYIAEMKRNNISILLPNVNESTTSFRLIDGKLLMPLTGISRFPRQIIENIIAERDKNGKFTSVKNFVVRMHTNGTVLSDKAYASLIDAGIFDSIYSNRKTLKNNINRFREWENTLDSNSLFNDYGLDDSFINPVPDDPLERIQNEYQALGTMISDSPLKHIDSKFLEHKNIIEISDLEERKPSYILGIVQSIKNITVKSGKDAGKPMGFILVHDNESEIDCVLFTTQYAQYGANININDILLINGTKDSSRGKNSFIINTIERVEN